MWNFVASAPVGWSRKANGAEARPASGGSGARTAARITFFRAFVEARARPPPRLEAKRAPLPARPLAGGPRLCRVGRFGEPFSRYVSVQFRLRARRLRKRAVSLMPAHSGRVLRRRRSVQTRAFKGRSGSARCLVRLSAREIVPDQSRARLECWTSSNTYYATIQSHLPMRRSQPPARSYDVSVLHDCVAARASCVSYNAAAAAEKEP